MSTAKLLRMPSFQLEDGAQGTKSVTNGGVTEDNVPDWTPTWVVSDIADLDKTLIRSNDTYPVCWSRDSLAKLIATNIEDTDLTVDDLILFEPDNVFAKENTLIRPPRAIIFVGGAAGGLSGTYDLVIDGLKDQLNEKGIFIFLVIEDSNLYLWDGFITAGFPIESVDYIDGTDTDPDGDGSGVPLGTIINPQREFPTITDLSNFLGGELLVISDQSAQGGNISFSAYTKNPTYQLTDSDGNPIGVAIDSANPEAYSESIENDVSQITDAVKGFNKFKNQIILVTDSTFVDTQPDSPGFATYWASFNPAVLSIMSGIVDALPSQNYNLITHDLPDTIFQDPDSVAAACSDDIINTIKTFFGLS